MVPFDALFPEIGFDETRTITLLQSRGRIPAGEYGLREFYCVERGCDCRRVILHVHSRGLQQVVATINHAFDPPGPEDADLPGQTFLDPLGPQWSSSEDLLDLFLDVVLQPDYAARLERHYRMVKDALESPGHPIHGNLAKIQVGSAADEARARRRQAQQRRAEAKRRVQRRKHRRR